ncbi:MAG: DUF1330 domain-containing protein [Xanthomonadales bacterium]|nr:DUF1330 domain-containing protein [Xanthomonadales bacterium]
MTDILNAQQRQVLAAIPADRPFVMLNLLRYRVQADYGPHATGAACSGREAYQRYAREAARAVATVGGELQFVGTALPALIGPSDEVWEQVMLVRYPSVSAFQQMLGLPDYRAALRHRLAALSDSRLIPVLDGPG